jgi:hypothetical protein
VCAEKVAEGVQRMAGNQLMMLVAAAGMKGCLRGTAAAALLLPNNDAMAAGVCAMAMLSI